MRRGVCLAHTFSEHVRWRLANSDKFMESGGWDGLQASRSRRHTLWDNFKCVEAIFRFKCRFGITEARIAAEPLSCSCCEAKSEGFERGSVREIGLCDLWKETFSQRANAGSISSFRLLLKVLSLSFFLRSPLRSLQRVASPFDDSERERTAIASPFADIIIYL